MGQRTYTVDAELQFKDSYAVAASAAAQVGGVNKIIDVGAARFEAVMLIDVSAIKISSTDELYGITIQGSNSATFASGIENLGGIGLGATAVRTGSAKDSVVGRYEIPFCNEQADVVYEYLRVYTKVSGSTPSINYTAWAAEGW